MVSQHLIAVVDDDFSVRRALGRLLSSAGFEVASFGSGEELLTSDVAAAAECLVLDVQLDGLDGFETCDKLREAGVGTSVIFITAHDSPQVRARAATVPHGFFLRKPFDATALLDLICVAVREVGRSAVPGSSAAGANS